MYYLIGDIHGHIYKFINLFKKIRNNLTDQDTLIFLGDYIDRGEFSFEVVDFLISLSKAYNTYFLKGNHEAMFLDYLHDQKKKNDIFLFNGGDSTIRSYKKNCGEFSIPKNHMEFYNNLHLYYKSEDFIAVHAGLNPKINNIEDQEESDMIWIRDRFFRAAKKWEKTIIFGHTPTHFVTSEAGVYFDDTRNIIGIDSGVIYGKEISCLRWPDRKIFTSE